MQRLWQDIRYGARMLAIHRGFTVVAVVTLALGVGASTLIFSLFETLYWRPLAIPEPARLVHVFTSRTEGAGYSLLSYPDYLFYRANARSFADLAAHYASAPLNFASASESKEINGSVVTRNYFDVLGLRPALGRFFRPDEDAVPGRDPVVVVSHAFWRSQLQADPESIGRTIQLNGTPFAIVGVAPVGFAGVIVGGLATDVWMPSAMFRVGYRHCDAVNDRGCRIVQLLGRLREGVTPAVAQEELTVLAARLDAASASDGSRAWRPIVRPARGAPPYVQEEQGRTPELMAAAVALLLVIACANVAGLLLARALHRQRELAVRAALGATRTRLIGQLLTESALLAAVGGAGALLVALWGKDLLLAYYQVNSEGQRTLFVLDPDPLVFAFALTTSLVAAAIFGGVPALAASRPDLLRALNDGAVSGRRRGRLRDALVVAQVALSLVLLTGAGLLTRSLLAVYGGPGYDPSHVALFRLAPSRIARTPAAAAAYQEAVIRRLESVPGVISASPADFPPLPGWDGNDASVWRPGDPPPRPEAAFRASYNRVGPRYFETLGVPILDGREFDAQDRRGAPDVAIVNDVLAERLWPGERAVGRTLVVDDRPRQVVGVVKSAQYVRAAERLRPFVYLCFWQNPSIVTEPIDSRTHVRVAGNAGAMLSTLRRALIDVDRDVPISEDRTLAQWLDFTFRPVRAVGTLLVCFGGLALFLAVIGLYGVTSTAVSIRSREIAIRVALGAARHDVARLIGAYGARLTALGVAAGAIASLAAGRLLETLLYGVGPFDLLTLAGGIAAIAGAALAAIVVPARRATQVDPIATLKCQ